MDGSHLCWSPPCVAELIREQGELLVQLRNNLSRAQQRMTATANRHRRHVEFDVGDFIWLKLQPYRQHSVVKPVSVKLGKRFYGPFEVVKRIGPVAYKLRLPEGSRIHDVFHVSLLRAFVKDDPVVPLPETFVGNRPVAQPVSILDSKTLWHKGEAVEHVLVRWSDGTDSPSWEPFEELRKRYPTLSLEDKEVSKEGGVVTASTESQQTTETIGVDVATEGEVEAAPVGELEKGAEDDTRRKLRPRKDLKQPERYRTPAAR